MRRTPGHATFRAQLLDWYRQHRRPLPWRQTRDPYRILVSEIMLQQTRVAVVEGRYRQFLRQFPTVRKLARAGLHSVLAAWSGLGYYRRARSLHAAARQIVRDRGFPQSSLELMELPGVGRYTANAVASIAFNEPVPVVDGNVKRVLSRFSGRALSDAQCWQTAEALLDRGHPGDFNQAIMELGALVCLPRRPLCSQCPVRTLCASQSAEPPRRHAPRKKAALNYALALRDNLILLQQRPRHASLMPEMWELPPLPAVPRKLRPFLRLRHSITNTDYAVSVYTLDPSRSPRNRWITLGSARRLPLTGLTRKILQELSKESSGRNYSGDHSFRVALRAGTRAT